MPRPVSVFWSSGIRGNIGVLLCERDRLDPQTKETHVAYIGIVIGADEKADIQFLKDYGSKIPVEAALNLPMVPVA